jgi:hypothetical protein
MFLRWLSKKASREIEKVIDENNTTGKPSIWTQNLFENKYFSGFFAIVFVGGIILWIISVFKIFTNSP